MATKQGVGAGGIWTSPHPVPGLFYPFANYAADGGLISYGIDAGDVFHRGVSYVDRILTIGTKRTYRVALHMSAFGGKTDMAIALRNVR